MQLDAVAIATAHFGNLLPLAHRLIFFDQQGLVVGIGGQVSVVVLENDQVAIAAQTSPNINNPAVGGSDDRVARDAANVEAFVLDLIKSGQHRTAGRPDPVDIIVRCRGNSRPRRRTGRSGSRSGSRRRRSRHRRGSGRGNGLGDHPAGRTGCYRRHHPQHLTDFNTIGILQITPARNILGSLPVFQANANQGVAGFDCVVTGLACILKTWQLLDVRACRFHGHWFRLAHANPAIFHRRPIKHSGATPPQHPDGNNSNQSQAQASTQTKHTKSLHAIPDFKGTKWTASSTICRRPCGVLSITTSACRPGAPAPADTGATNRPPMAS